MGNAISGGGGGGSRKMTESTRSGVPDLMMTTTSTAADDAVSELTRDVELLKAAMDEKDRTIEQLAGAIEDIRVSTTISII